MGVSRLIRPAETTLDRHFVVSLSRRDSIASSSWQCIPPSCSMCCGRSLAYSFPCVFLCWESYSASARYRLFPNASRPLRGQAGASAPVPFLFRLHHDKVIWNYPKKNTRALATERASVPAPQPNVRVHGSSFRFAHRDVPLCAPSVRPHTACFRHRIKRDEARRDSKGAKRPMREEG